MTLDRFGPTGPPICPRCGGQPEMLLPSDNYGGRIAICRSPEHGELPLLIVIPHAADPREVVGTADFALRLTRRLAGRIVDLEREVSEIIRTGRSTSERVKRHHGAGSVRLPAGAVAGTRIGPDDYRELAAELRSLAHSVETRGDQVDRERIRRVADRAMRMFGEYDRATAEYPGTMPSGTIVDETRPPPRPAPPVLMVAEDGNLGVEPLTAHPAEMTDAPHPPRIAWPPIEVDEDIPPGVIEVRGLDGTVIASIDYRDASLEDLSGAGERDLAVDLGMALAGADLERTPLNPRPDELILHSTSRLAGTTSPTGRPDLDVPCGACSCGWHGPFGHPHHEIVGSTHRWAEHLGGRVFVSECKRTGPAIELEVNGLRRLT